MNISLLRQPLGSVQAQWLVLGIFEDESEPPTPLRGTALEELLKRLIAEKDVTGSLGELTPLYEVAGFQTRGLMLVGLGPRDRFDAGAAFSAGFAFSKRLASKRKENVAVALPPSNEPLPVAKSLIEGAIVATRGPGLKKSEANRHAFHTLSLVIEPENADDDGAIRKLLSRAEIVGAAVNLARDLVNTPPGDKTPARLADRIEVVASDAGLAVEVWDESRIRAERFGGLLGVAAGSDEPPRFMVLEYLRGGDSPFLALVGKGVTFDSGGLCLKPAASMEDMKSDMTGAAVVAAAMQAIARARLAGERGGLPRPDREHDRRKSHEDGRRAHDAQRQDGRDHEYRRGGTADSGRCAGLRRRTAAAPRARPGHAHRRLHRGAGPEGCRALQ